MNKSDILLEVTGLTRHFGNVKAVNGASFTLKRGQVVGLIGANGAGKTTSMRMLATLDVPDAGSIIFDGIDLLSYPDKVRPRIGWMPDYFHPYKNTGVREYLDFFARAYELPADKLISTVDEVMEFTELHELSTRLIDKLSKGQTQRLCLARTLISDPDFLILDEPAAGLDPKARLEFKNLVQLLKKRGKTMLISSHILSELGEMCDSLIFMDAGTVVHDGDKEELLVHSEEEGWTFEIKIAEDSTERLENLLTLQPGWTLRSVQDRGVTATFASTDQHRIAEALRDLCATVPVVDFHRSERRLEEAFVDILRNKNTAAPTGTASTVTPPPLPTNF